MLPFIYGYLELRVDALIISAQERILIYEEYHLLTGRLAVNILQKLIYGAEVNKRFIEGFSSRLS